MKLIIILFILFTVLEENSQAQESKILQFSGIVSNELLKPIPYVNVKVLHKPRGSVTDKNGMFTIIMEPTDTILFTCIGYKKSKVFFPKSTVSDFVTVDVILEKDTLMLNEVEVLPWKTYDEFRIAFKNLQLPDDDYQRANRNMAIIRAQVIMNNSSDPNLNFDHVMMGEYNRLTNAGMLPTTNLFNPFAWIKFFRAIKNGDFKDKSGD
jgi:hypothetical protein